MASTRHLKYEIRLIGFVLTLLILLVFLEYQHYYEQRLLNTVEQDVVSVQADSINASQDGELVYMTGEMATQRTLSDQIFPIDEQAICLERFVEKYEPDEQDETLVWNQLDYFRRSEANFEPTETCADDAKVGAYSLPAEMLDYLKDREPVELDEDFVANLPDEVFAEITKIEDDSIYLSHDPDTSINGDQRLTFRTVKPGPVSIVAQQSQGELVPYRPFADKDITMLNMWVRSSFALVEQGTVSLETMIDDKREELSQRHNAYSILILLFFLGILITLTRMIITYDAGRGLPILEERPTVGGIVLGVSSTLSILMVIYGFLWIGVYTLAPLAILGGLLLGAATVTLAVMKW